MELLQVSNGLCYVSIYTKVYFLNYVAAETELTSSTCEALGWRQVENI